MKDQSMYAVLTGDLIRSTKLTTNQLKQVRDELLGAVDEVKSWKKGLVLSKAEFFRGDSWQMLLSEPGMALRVALFLRAKLRAQGIADTRIAIGIGAVDEIAKQRVSLSSGEAFVLSGQALDQMKSMNRMTLACTGTNSLMTAWVNLVVQLCDELTIDWKPKQAKVVALAIASEGLLHEQIAQLLKPAISKQGVTKALKGAHWHHLQASLQLFDNADWKTICSIAT